jgi:hypothetical protein
MWLIIYIDDIIIFTDSYTTHLEKVLLVLSRIESINMKISLSKCSFCFSKLTALGHVVTGLSLGIDQHRVAAVLLKPPPTNLKDLQSFLGFASYYRLHIKDFNLLASSLYKLTSPSAVFEMTADRLAAFESLRLALTSAPLLFHLDPNRPFKLYVDACFEGIGAALHQVQVIHDKEVEGPICFISRQLKESEKRMAPRNLNVFVLFGPLRSYIII